LSFLFWSYLDWVILLRLEAGERHTMKSMNFIFSSGALIFLLLVVGPAFAAKNYGQTGCTTAEVCEPPAAHIQCAKGGTAGNGAAPDTPGTAITAADDATPDANTCLCGKETAKLFWDSVKTECVDAKPSTGGGATPTKEVEHGHACNATAGCVAPFACRVGGDGKDGMMADVQGTADVDATTTGKCICKDPAHFFHGGATPCTATAKPTVGGAGTATHDAPCTGGSTDSAMICMTGLKCLTAGAGSTEVVASAAGKCMCPDAAMPMWSSGTCTVGSTTACPADKPNKKEDGTCVKCDDGMAWDADKKECMGGSSESPPGPGEATTNGSERSSYDAVSLKWGVAAMGSFLVFLVSA